MAGTTIGIRDEIAALKRTRILAAAADLFYDNGYENTTLDAVAERLGVSKPFIYAHFSSKAELLAEICSRGIASSLEALDQALALDASPGLKLEALSKGFASAVLQSQTYIAIFSREEKNLRPEDFDRINDMRRDFDRKLTDLLRQGVELGEFTLSDAHMAALGIGGMVSWAYVWYRKSGRLSIPQVADEMSGLILAMVQYRPRAGRKAG
ncbi:MAG: TetR family transcriptional regulator [Rhizobiaceae bacterium]|nr:TetR family transcriptional regulator [Rhizobiaceae bacterium]